MWGVFLPVACCHVMSEPGGEKDWRLSACAHGDKCLTGRHFVGQNAVQGGPHNGEKPDQKGSGSVAKLAEEQKSGAQKRTDEIK